ncbi:DNA phosphorothioation-associated putative methyltransferase [Streptomyces sp. NPDC050263]|uniref:DNA phosphorothioation-associated putative methyltransferase n=1 Tax=Streptomyces sp. NPDC050263 TaxID=3155037 RepID=UPI0034161507
MHVIAVDLTYRVAIFLSQRLIGIAERDNGGGTVNDHRGRLHSATDNQNPTRSVITAVRTMRSAVNTQHRKARPAVTGGMERQAEQASTVPHRPRHGASIARFGPHRLDLHGAAKAYGSMLLYVDLPLDSWEAPMTLQSWSSHRHRTAIGRVGLSAPARQAVMDLQMADGTQVLDYGCGRGGDVRALEHLGLDVSGWDPVHRPNGELRPSDIVLLTYVLNVIERPEERHATLAKAWEHTKAALVVSARLRWERNQIKGTEYGDGILTSRNTFQHLFAASELRDFVQDVTGVRCLSAAPGIVYAFKSDEARLAYLARQITPDATWLASEDTASAIAAVVDHLEQRGRLPHLEETPQPVMELLRHMRPQELKRLAEQAADPSAVESGAKNSALDTLLFLAVELFHGRGPASSLPVPVQLDIRAFFSSYTEACKRADRLLYKLRDDAYVRRAMTGSVAGKFTATALYVHRRAVHRIPTVLRLYEQCASIAAGRPAEWSVVCRRRLKTGSRTADQK